MQGNKLQCPAKNFHFGLLDMQLSLSSATKLSRVERNPANYYMCKSQVLLCFVYVVDVAFYVPPGHGETDPRFQVHVYKFVVNVSMP